MGVVGAGQDQLAAGVDDLGVGPNVSFHLGVGAPVDDEAALGGDGLNIVEVLVYRGDFTVLDDEICLYYCHY